ncbi:MAG: cyclic pyranopterin monophosphate synthase MoaC [Candidatus Thorarchaeota archaeon]|nr:cyclic pyranopterin monophosphate synthase MoaC [Candidatus Thorarchaeota archaeon]
MTENDPVSMVDISEKGVVERTAEAEGEIHLHPSTIEAIRTRSTKKGDVLTVSEIAGIQAAKKTAELIPLCHQIPLSTIQISFTIEENHIVTRCLVRARYTTGVEMEALVGTTTALLSIWDMVKYLEKDEAGQYPVARLENIRVIRKEKRTIVTA